VEKNSILVFVATYNERDNVENLYKEIKYYNKNVDILFCDDNSPDGTGKILDHLAKKDPTITVMHRPKKLGLGTAHYAAFEFVQQHKYQYLITMDADFTHHPSYIPHMLEKKDQADVVIGSRYVHGGAMSGWGKLRLPATHFWRNMIKRGLGMPYDCTGAFRLYSVKKLNPEIYTKVKSRGFAFGMETLYRMHQSGCTVVEIPIHAHSRVHGKSKLSFGIIKEFIRTLLRLSFEKKHTRDR
jgi:dolichol-phosphate mannosyltransferase